MKLSVVIPTRERPDAVLAAVRSCLDQTLAPDAYEIIVVANPPSPAIEALLAELARGGGRVAVRYLPCPRLGANAARNVGLVAAHGELLYFIDDDCTLRTREQLAHAVALHAAAPATLGLGGIYLSAPRRGWITRFYNAMTELWLRRNATSDGGQLVLLGGNAVYKRALVSAGHRFAEELTYGGTETEFNHRLVAAGARLELRDELAVVHHFDCRWRALWWRAWRQGAGKRIDTDARELKRRRAATALFRTALVNDPRPRSAFWLFVLIYYSTALVAGWLAGRRSAPNDPLPPTRTSTKNDVPAVVVQ
ncbi:MAG: glycosyltransferase family 2 protein [Planctomycetota bacterium]